MQRALSRERGGMEPVYVSLHRLHALGLEKDTKTHKIHLNDHLQYVAWEI